MAEVQVLGAGWCGFTKKMKQQVADNAQDLQSKGIKVDYVECTDENNKDMCSGVTGFPTLKNGCGQVNAGFLPHEKFIDFALCEK